MNRSFAIGSALLSLIGLSSTELCAQKIYKWTDERGQVQYTQHPPPEGVEAQMKVNTDVDLSPERVAFCEHIREVAHRVAMYKAQGMPAKAAAGSLLTRRAEMNIQIASNQIDSLVGFVFSTAVAGAYHVDVAKAAYEACLTGRFGKHSPPQVAAAAPKAGAEEKRVSMGTGWIAAGRVVTNHHVIDGSSKVSVRLHDGKELRAFVRESDARNDVAVLSVAGDLGLGLPVAGSEAGIGAEVFTIGYPHIDIMGHNAKLTTGIINATTGLQDDPRLYQISVPVQSGNSGGPLINMRGEVVGLVTAKLSAAKVFQWTGDLPQNVNYAVKVQFASKLLDANTNAPTTTVADGTLEDLASRVQSSVVMVIAE